jgi:hypothetical protein
MEDNHNMKYVKQAMVILSLLILLTGCTARENGSKYESNNNSIDNVLNEQISSAESEDVNETKSSEILNDTVADDVQTDNLQETKEQEMLDQEEMQSEENIDYDLTSMGSDLVYATVYQLMVNPNDYIGKTFRIKGNYYASYYEETKQYYHCCIIQDATACCSQGLEFVWDDGSHAYPDEYPEDNVEIVVTGIFETYNEEGDSNLYCRLKDATLEIVDVSQSAN